MHGSGTRGNMGRVGPRRFMRKPQTRDESDHNTKKTKRNRAGRSLRRMGEIVEEWRRRARLSPVLGNAKKQTSELNCQADGEERKSGDELPSFRCVNAAESSEGVPQHSSQLRRCNQRRNRNRDTHRTDAELVSDPHYVASICSLFRPSGVGAAINATPIDAERTRKGERTRRTTTQEHQHGDGERRAPAFVFRI